MGNTKNNKLTLRNELRLERMQELQKEREQLLFRLETIENEIIGLQPIIDKIDQGEEIEMPEIKFPDRARANENPGKPNKGN